MITGANENFGLLILIAVVVYLVAAIPFGVIVSRLVIGKDVRQHGSGNIGATNVSRLMGKKWGVFVLFLDALKGFSVVWIPLHCMSPEVYLLSFANVCGALAVIAHCYPIYLKFKGGKGVATALGVVLALSPLCLAVGFVVFIVTILTSRRVSAASLLAALSLPVSSILASTPLLPPTALLICAVVWLKHRENIKRLLAGAEPRFF